MSIDLRLSYECIFQQLDYLDTFSVLYMSIDLRLRYECTFQQLDYLVYLYDAKDFRPCQWESREIGKGGNFRHTKRSSDVTTFVLVELLNDVKHIFTL